MGWEDVLKEKDIADERFPDNERDWMEHDIATSHDEDKHRNGDIRGLVDWLHNRILEYLDDFGPDVGDGYAVRNDKKWNEAEIKKLALPLAKYVITENVEYDMSKFRYSGP
mgnify:CR=1 FL=1|tara:strand:- start:428 stop:760 length:333 start_codon:yes stop_codon:yes gene_type:complete